MSINLCIKRERNTTGSAVIFRIFVDDIQVDIIGNNQEKKISIPSGTHKIYLKLWNGKTSPSLIVDAGDGETIVLKCGITWMGGVFFNKTISRLASPKNIKEVNNYITKNNTALEFFYKIIFLFLSIFGGLTIGVVFGIIAPFIYLIILFPIIMGFAAGNVITENIQYTKIRNKYFVLFSSVLIVLTLYISFHFISYKALSAVTVFQVAGDFSDKSLEIGKNIFEYTIKQETGYSGFLGYILLKAQQGVSIGKIFSSNKLNLGPIFTWLYWLIEIGVICFITINVSKQALKKPFCEFCNSWYEENKYIGSVHNAQQAEFLDQIERKDFANTGAMLVENAESPSLELHLQYCNSCDQSDAFLKITSEKFIDGRLVINELSKITLKSQELDLLLEGIKYPLY